jgi:hypothetical protein
MGNPKKYLLSMCAILSGFALSGCATMSNSLKSIDANVDWERPALTADLDVSFEKVVGIATGRKDKLSAIRKVAMLDALVKYNAGKLDKGIADLIVEPTYFYEYDGLGGVKVTVIGYPARYKNFRMIEKPSIPLNDTGNIPPQTILKTTKHLQYSQDKEKKPYSNNRKIVGGQWLIWTGFSLLGVGIPLTAVVEDEFAIMVVGGGTAFLGGTTLYTFGVIDRRKENRYGALLPDRLQISPNKLEFVWAF